MQIETHFLQNKSKKMVIERKNYEMSNARVLIERFLTQPEQMI